jgi:hypothetical protein
MPLFFLLVEDNYAYRDGNCTYIPRTCKLSHAREAVMDIHVNVAIGSEPRFTGT